MNQKRYFNGGLNADADFELVAPNQWVNAENIRTFSTDAGAVDRIEAVSGNTLLAGTLPSGQNHCIGSTSDDATNRIFWFNWNAAGNHGIYCYDKAANTTYTLLLNANVTGGLGFNKYFYIHSCFVANGSLYWVNSSNTPPRRLFIDAAIKAYQVGYATTAVAYTFPIAQNVISWIRKPGGAPPTATKVTQASPAIGFNYIRFEAFQFSYTFNFRTYELSTLAPYSALSNYNVTAEAFNRIDVQIPVAQPIEQDVLSIDLVVRFVETDNYFIIKSWSKNNTAEAAEIAAHVAGTTALTYKFYNDVAGIPVDDVYKAKLFDSIPLYAETAALAKGRGFMGNYVEGYDTPADTSLAIQYTLQTIGAGATLSSLTARWYKINFRTGTNALFSFFVLQTNFPIGPLAYSPVYYYKLTTPLPPYPPFPTTANSSNLVYYGASIPAAISSYRVENGITNPYVNFVEYIDQGVSVAVTIAAPVTSLFLAKAFKSGASYQVGITFYDEFQRKCGVKTNESLIVNVPEAVGINLFVNRFIWTLDNSTALTQIPVWAKYYSVNITKCLKTRFFLDFAGAATYAVKELSTGLYTYTGVYANTNAGIAVDLSGLTSYAMGYSFNEGDLATIYINGNTYTKSVIDTDGKYVILELENLGTLLSTSAVVEIFSPYKKQITEPFYEVGNMYQVIDAGLVTRQYSLPVGIIGGDVYLFSRSYTAATFVAQTMSPNDKFWQIWNTDAGRPNIIDTIGQAKKENSIAFSDVFLPGTRVNGLSSFSTLNTETFDVENGSIQKLQLANKIQADGGVMLAICKNEAVSVYLGEQELFDTQGSAFIARASTVIGSFKALKDGMGTSNPESVTENNGLIWWWDLRNGSAVQYSTNGLFAVSNNKLTRPANLFSKKFSSLLATDIEALGSRPYIVGGYDPHHNEVLFTIPKVLSAAPKGNLSDYSSPNIIYPYDIYDGQGKTLMYKSAVDMWIGAMTFEAEKFVRLGNDLYAFKNGLLYIQNQPTTTLFGNAYKAKIMYPANPRGINSFCNVGIEVNKTPSFVHIRTENPYIQSSDLVGDGFPAGFTVKDGVRYAPILRDRLSPNSAGGVLDKQINGDDMFGKFLLMMLQFDVDSTPLELKFSNIVYEANNGHII